jgi:hypothetical protein
LLPAGANRRVGLAPTGKRRLVTAHTQGVSFSNNSPCISMSGAFSGQKAQNTMGSFDGNFCYEACNTGIYVVRNINGTFSATKTR